MHMKLTKESFFNRFVIFTRNFETKSLSIVLISELFKERKQLESLKFVDVIKPPLLAGTSGIWSQPPSESCLKGSEA